MLSAVQCRRAHATVLQVMRSRCGIGRHLLWSSLVLGATLVSACARTFDDCTSRAACLGAASGSASGETGSPGAGAGGDSTGESEPILLPACTFGEGVAIQGLLGLAVSKTGDGAGINVYSWDQPTNSAVVRWTNQLNPIRWTPWQCFDLLPGITRLSAISLSNLLPEVYALSSSGFLFVRRDTTQGWTPWLPFGLPFKTSVLTDVAAVSGKLARVYVADHERQQVFVRRKVSPSAFADYGPWQPLTPSSVETIVALERRDRSQQLIGAGPTGVVETTVELPVAEGFDDWRALPDLPGAALELEAVDAGALVIYALDNEGVVRALRAESPDATWFALPQPEALGKIVGLAAWVDGDEPQLLTLDADGNVDVRVGLD